VSKFLTWLKAWWPTILPGVVALWGAYGTQVQAFISAHPELAGLAAALYAVFSHLMPSPVANSTKDGTFLAK
jgi:hypothetical protein